LQPVVLTIAESWYPHWRVEIDDQPGEVLRVNWALLGVRLDAGMHRIRFYYQRPWYLHLGYGITLLTVLSLMLWAARYLAKRVSRSPGAEMERIKKEALDSLRRDS